MSVRMKRYLKAMGIKHPVLVRRMPQGLRVTDPAIVSQIGSQSEYLLVDNRSNLRWLVGSTSGTIAIYS